MATNEHNPGLGNLLTAMSGSTINIVNEIDSAITDIQNYIDSTKSDINNSITTSQNNIYSHISGSTISINNFIDEAITNINNNVDSKTNNLSIINNALLGTGDLYLGIPNMNVGQTYRGKRCSTSITEEALFYFYNPNYLFVQAWNDPTNSVSGEVTIYYDSIDSANIIAHAIIPPGESQIVACFPALVNGECFITVKSDGTNPVCVATQSYTSAIITPIEITTGHSNSMVKSLPTTVVTDSTQLSVQWKTSALVTRQYLWFDISAIPTISQISQAYLDLSLYDDYDAQDFHIGLCSEDAQWGEVCYNDRKSGIAWTTPADGHPNMLPTPIFSGNITGVLGDHCNFDITDSVKGWLDGSVPNYGLILYKYPLVDENLSFCGFTHTTQSYRPRLKISIL